MGATVGVRVTSLESEHPLERVRVDLLRFPDEYIQEGFTDSVGRLEFQGLRAPAAYISPGRQGWVPQHRSPL